jgi:hypothetical protein
MLLISLVSPCVFFYKYVLGLQPKKNVQYTYQQHHNTDLYETKQLSMHQDKL